MTGFLDYFGAAYLINLPERKDRLRSATKELARAGWKLGPNGVQLYSAQKFSDRAAFPSASIRGCFHSHSECIRSARRQGKKSVLLFEDDIALSSSMSRLAPSIISQLESAPWDFVYLGHESTGKIGRANSKTTTIKLERTQNEVLTAHFFAINREIFDKLIDHLDRVADGVEGDQIFGPMPVDGAYNIFRRKNPHVRTLIANPKLGWQRPSRSDITPRSFDALKLAQPLFNIMRDLKHLATRWRS